MSIKKRLILAISLLGSLSLVLFVNPVSWNLCSQLDYSCREMYSALWQSFLLFPIILFFSLLTFSLPERVFMMWSNFTQFFAPLTFVVLLLLSFEIHHATNGQWQDMFDSFFLMAVMSFYVLGSLIQITRAYLNRYE